LDISTSFDSNQQQKKLKNEEQVSRTKLPAPPDLVCPPSLCERGQAGRGGRLGRKDAKNCFMARERHETKE